MFNRDGTVRCRLEVKDLLDLKGKTLTPENGEMSILVVRVLMSRPKKQPSNLMRLRPLSRKPNSKSPHERRDPKEKGSISHRMRITIDGILLQKILRNLKNTRNDLKSPDQ
jgi:hypothetical protein